MEGCLIVALGTPRALTENAIREFLSEFLSDQRVVDFPRALWNPILNGIVLRVRPGKVMEQYEHVWLHDGERAGSPLLVHTLSEVDHLRAALPDVDVDYAVTYTTPSIRERLDAMVARGVTRITVIPLYPHYAPSTVQPIIDQVEAYEGQRGKLPPIRVVRSYETQPTMVRWYAQRIAEVLRGAQASYDEPADGAEASADGEEPAGGSAEAGGARASGGSAIMGGAAAMTDAPVDRLVFSYHGVPERRVHGPDAYQAECEATTDAIMAELERLAAREGWRVPKGINTYQSKFGPGKWLAPATIDTMAALPGEGVRSIVVATPGFFADCIETSYELDMLNQEEFLKAGGERYVRVAPINSDAIAGQILAEVYRGAQG